MSWTFRACGSCLPAPANAHPRASWKRLPSSCARRSASGAVLPLPGLLLESRGRDEIAQLDELRLTALMDRIDCDIALGRHEQVLGELSLLVREHPLRERLRAQQMLALYRADRQAEALDAYAEARRTLVDDLGIEPSEALQRLQQAILRHDPSLATPAGTAAVNGVPPSAAVPPPTPTAGVEDRAPRRRFRPRRWQLALAAVAILAAAAAAAVTLSTPAAATPHVIPNSLVRLDPRSGKIVSVTPVGVEPGPIAVTPSAIWTVNFGARTVSRYDLRTHGVDQKGGFPIRPYGIVADHDGNVWVSSEASIITRIARGSGGTSAGPLYFSHTKIIRLPRPGAGSLALGGGYLWVIVGPYTAPGDNRITQVSLARDQPVRSWQLKGDTVAIAFGDGAAWVTTNYAAGPIERHPAGGAATGVRPPRERQPCRRRVSDFGRRGWRLGNHVGHQRWHWSGVSTGTARTRSRHTAEGQADPVLRSGALGPRRRRRLHLGRRLIELESP